MNVEIDVDITVDGTQFVAVGAVDGDEIAERTFTATQGGFLLLDRWITRNFPRGTRLSIGAPAQALLDSWGVDFS